MLEGDSGDFFLTVEGDLNTDFSGFLPLDELGFMFWCPVEIHKLGNLVYDCHCL